MPLAMIWPKRIGEMGLTFGSTSCINGSISSDSEYSNSECNDSECSDSECSEKTDDISDNSVVSVDKEECNDKMTLPDPVKFPLLHFLFSNQPGNSRVMNQLLIELKNLHGNDAIKFIRGNNTEGLLLNLPSF